jgi:hypothetical protein
VGGIAHVNIEETDERTEQFGLVFSNLLHRRKHLKIIRWIQGTYFGMEGWMDE